MAELDQTEYKTISNDDLFEEIERMWIIKGLQPTTTDVKKGFSKYSLNTYARHFGSWRNALKAFIDWIYLDKEKEYDVDINLIGDTVTTNNNPKTDKQYPVKCRHRTPRDVNYKLRFQVMQRDNFKCCACGASPAKDPAVELHVDHIFPWSKGGETVMENLQTLCSKCNLGKSDLTDSDLSE